MAVPHLLDLGPDHIRLLGRIGDEFEILGEISTDADDLTPRLKALVASIGARPLPVVLVLPESQILYTRVDAPGPDDAAREAAVLAGLDGRTPYALDEITFDWAPDGSDAEGQMALVAAIALETLDEAEAFAAAHGLDVRGFAALPEPELFPREVVFRHPGRAAEASDAGAEGNDTPVEDTPAPTLADPPSASAPSFATMRAEKTEAGSDAQALAARLAATAARFRPSEQPATVAAGVTARDLPADAAPAGDTDAVAGPVVTSGPGFTADALPDRGAGATAARPPAAAAPSPGATAPTPSAPQADGHRFGATATTGRRRLVLAAVVALLLIAGGWTLLATFAPPAPTDAALPLADGQEIPENATAGIDDADAPDRAALDLNAQAFAPTPEELAEGEDGAVPEAPVVAAAPPRALVDTPPVAGRLLELLDGVWMTPPAAPQAPGLLSDLDVEFAAIDPVSTATDAFAMPLPGAVDRLPSLAGRPGADAPTTPPAIPPGAVALDLVEGTVGDGDALVPTELAAALSAADRPRARPDGLVEEAERARFNGLTRADLAELRPADRPPSPQADPSVNPEATALAVQRSPLPRARPEDFESIIAAARPVLSPEQPEAAAAASTAALAPAAPAPGAAPAAAPDVTAEEAEDSEPEVVASAQPSLPTRAEVAREATLENAMRLNQVNLIGVYGTPSDRRALVRLPSGRFVRVKVGDRVDGGRVAAIGDTSLRYVKSGREHTLVLPSG
ncbi:hypothetical protein ACRDNQ_14645 [Palleronia sp. KMU-117]|uniref:hypothetical protein n=1 Tax=Palleronia sp. KMU-117 TaxID=3434108 RepID=UPI003D72B9ED